MGQEERKRARSSKKAGRRKARRQVRFFVDTMMHDAWGGRVVLLTVSTHRTLKCANYPPHACLVRGSDLDVYNVVEPSWGIPF